MDTDLSLGDDVGMFKFKPFGVVVEVAFHQARDGHFRSSKAVGSVRLILAMVL